MRSAVFSVPRQSLSHGFLSGIERRPREAEQFSRKASFVGPGINHKGVQSRGNWNALNGVTVRKKKSCKNPTQIMEDKENAGKQPVQVNPMERSGTTVLQTVQSHNLCAASVISKDFENLRLEEEKYLSLERNTADISHSRSLVKSVADKHSVANTGNSDVQITQKTMHGLEKLNSDAKLTKKPIRGVFRGRVVQSKVSSFWKVSDDESQAKASVLSNNLANCQPSNNLTVSPGNIARFKIKSSRKKSNYPLDKAHSAGVLKRPAKHSASAVKPTAKKQSSVTARTASVSSYVKLSSTAFSAHGTAARPNSCSDLDQKTKHATAAELPSGKIHPSRSFKVCKESKGKPSSAASAQMPNGKRHPSKSFNVCTAIKSKDQPLSTAATVGKNSCRPPVKQCLPTGQAGVSGARQSRVSKTTLASSTTISAPFRPKTVSEILTAVSTRFVPPKESAEEQRARLAQWQASKGKVMKRPPMVKMKVLPSDVHKETVQFIPECVNDDLQRLSKEEADEKDSECTKLNQTVSMLQNNPLNQNVGSPKYETVEIGKEEQNNNGELGENSEHLVQNEGLVDHETKSEVNTTFEMPNTENNSSNKKFNLRQAYKKTEDDKDGELQFITCSQLMSPDNEVEGSSVIRFNVRTTPSLKSLSNNMHSQLGDSTFKDFKFLTPVRRSLRIERKSFRLPEMLQDHDRCLSSLGELAELDGEVNAYIFRENNALRDLAKHANPQKEQ